jgi:hypothetical protein
MTVKGGHNYHENAYKTTFVNKIYMHNKEYFAIQFRQLISDLQMPKTLKIFVAD